MSFPTTEKLNSDPKQFRRVHFLHMNYSVTSQPSPQITEYEDVQTGTGTREQVKLPRQYYY